MSTIHHKQNLESLLHSAQNELAEAEAEHYRLIQQAVDVGHRVNELRSNVRGLKKLMDSVGDTQSTPVLSTLFTQEEHDAIVGKGGSNGVESEPHIPSKRKRRGRGDSPKRYLIRRYKAYPYDRIVVDVILTRGLKKFSIAQLVRAMYTKTLQEDERQSYRAEQSLRSSLSRMVDNKVFPGLEFVDDTWMLKFQPNIDGDQQVINDLKTKYPPLGVNDDQNDTQSTS